MSENSSEGDPGKLGRRDFLKATGIAAVIVAARLLISKRTVPSAETKRPEAPQINLPFEFKPLDQETVNELKKYSTSAFAFDHFEVIHEPRAYRISDDRVSGHSNDEDYSIFNAPSVDERGIVGNIPNNMTPYPFFGYPVAEVTKTLANTFKQTFLAFRAEDLNPAIRERVRVEEAVEVGNDSRLFFVCQRNQGYDNFVLVPASENPKMIEAFQGK